MRRRPELGEQAVLVIVACTVRARPHIPSAIGIWFSVSSLACASQGLTRPHPGDDFSASRDF